jgi:hypothetical protein
MTPDERLVAAQDQAEAMQLLETYPRYDVILIRDGDRLVAFIERGTLTPKPIRIQHVVSAETSIPELVESLCECRFVFIVGRQQVVGLVQLADLNDPIVKLPYFVLLDGLERQIADAIRPLVTEETLPRLKIDPDRLRGLKQKMAKLQKNDADRDWVTLLYFRELLEAAVHFGKLNLSAPRIDDSSTVRTRVSHAATDELVESHNDVRRLSRVHQLCVELLLGVGAARPSMAADAVGPAEEEPVL